MDGCGQFVMQDDFLSRIIIGEEVADFLELCDSHTGETQLTDPDKVSVGDEILEVVDKNGNVLELAKRSEIHGNPSLLHRVVHILVFDGKGRILLQKRSLNKDVAPGKWDTSVGGHVNPGEDILDAAKREMKEELGIAECESCLPLCAPLFKPCRVGTRQYFFLQI